MRAPWRGRLRVSTDGAFGLVRMPFADCPHSVHGPIGRRDRTTPITPRPSPPNPAAAAKRQEEYVSTRIVFDNGLKLIVAQDKAAVVEALQGDGEEVTLKGRNGRPLRINWDHVVAIQPLSRPPAVI